MNSYQIAVIAGDGIGPEVIAEVSDAVRRMQKLAGIIK